MPAATDTGVVSVYVIVCPERATVPAPIPYALVIVGVPPRPEPETANVIVLIVPAVVVLNEYEYETPVAETWLFETVQLMFVSDAARAFATKSARTHEPTTAAARASEVNRFRDRMPARFVVDRFMSFLSGRSGGTIAGNPVTHSVSGTPDIGATPG